MALADLTKEAVFAAIGEFDELGREAFLSKYGFGRSRGYFLEHAGKRYDSKAIVGWPMVGWAGDCGRLGPPTFQAVTGQLRSGSES